MITARVIGYEIDPKRFPSATPLAVDEPKPVVDISFIPVYGITEVPR